MKVDEFSNQLHFISTCVFWLWTWGKNKWK